MRPVVLTDEKVEWLTENHNRYTLVGLADQLEVGKSTVRRYLKKLGLSQMIEKPRLDLDDSFLENVEETLNVDLKIQKVKKILKPGMCIGPYIVVKPFEHHCLVKTKTGYNESVCYKDLSRYVKFTTPIMKENIK